MRDLLGCNSHSCPAPLGVAVGETWVASKPGGLNTHVLFGVFALLFAALSVLLVLVWHLPAPGDISQALTQHPELYTLSLGHIRDLTLGAFAYLNLPLGLAAFSLDRCVGPEIMGQ